MIEILTCVLLAIGTFFIAVSGIGLVRMPDVYAKLHATTKATTLGMGAILLASALHFGAMGVVVLPELATLLFVLLTNPVGGHMIARSAYLTGVRLSKMTVIDELDSAGARSDVEHDIH